MFYDDDIDVYFGDFSREITYTASGLSGEVIDGIVDEPGQVQVVGSYPMQITQRRVSVKSTDVPSPSTDDTVKIGASTYYVVGYAPDGTGLTVLTLSDSER